MSEKDIEPVESVRKFPALYEKTCPDYHRKDVQRNCWNSTAIGLLKLKKKLRNLLKTYEKNLTKLETR